MSHSTCPRIVVVGGLGIGSGARIRELVIVTVIGFSSYEFIDDSVFVGRTAGRHVCRSAPLALLSTVMPFFSCSLCPFSSPSTIFLQIHTRDYEVETGSLGQRRPPSSSASWHMPLLPASTRHQYPYSHFPNERMNNVLLFYQFSP